VSCEVNGDKILCGNAKMLTENGVTFKEVEDVGVKIYVAVNGEYAGAIILNDTARDTAYGAIMELYDAGVNNTVMLTGDNKEYAVAIRKQLNMRQSVSELLPQNKVEEVENLTNNGQVKVAYVGDGINDAPVLARADVGFAMGGLGSDLAIENADVVITDDDLSKIPFALKLAKRTNSIAKRNVVLSILVKAVIMLLSVFGLTSSIWLAISADVGVLILAILNAIRNNSKII
jgi:Cd2+/Zn2+-exporting ATPase